MANYGANLSLVPIYLEHESKDELVRLTFLNNQINQIKFNYMSPLKDGKKWIVWFYADIKDWKDPRKLSKDELRFVEGFNK